MKLLRLLEAINEDLYHATGRDVDEFLPLSHFGTAKAAADRANNLYDQPSDNQGPLRTYRASLDIKNPVHLHDIGQMHDTAYDIADGILMWYRDRKWAKRTFNMRKLSHMMKRWEKEFKNTKDLSNGKVVQSEWDAADARHREELIAFLKAAGHDGIAYDNDTEDSGSTSYISLDPVVAESMMGTTIRYRGMPKTAVKPARAHKDVLMMIPTDALDASFSKSDMYVGPGGSGAAIGKRYEGFEDWISKNHTYEVPEIYVHHDGSTGFTNGRHRYAVLRDAGVPMMPVAMSRAGVHNAEKLMGGVIRESDSRNARMVEMADPSLIKAAAPQALARLKVEIAKHIGDQGHPVDDAFLDDTDTQLDDPKWNEKAALWKESYAQRLLGQTISRLTKGADYRDGKLIVHRMLGLDHDEDLTQMLRDRGLGKYWTWDKGHADSYFGAGSVEWIITAAVDPKHVDWVETILLNAHPEYEDEREVRIPEGTPVKVLNIEVEGGDVDPSRYGGRGQTLMASLGNKS